MKSSGLTFRTIHRQYHASGRPREALECADALPLINSLAAARQRLLNLDANLSKLPSKLLERLISTACGERNHGKEIERDLHSLDCLVMEAPSWFMLSSLLLAIKEFHSALLARELAKERIRQYRRSLWSIPLCDLHVGQLLEDWNQEKLKSQLRIARWLRTECGRNRANPLLARLVTNETNRSHDEADQKYADYLTGRSVAVIGPLELSQDALDEIDGFDLVVGINDIRSFSGQPDSDLIHPHIVYLVGSIQQLMRGRILLSDSQPPRFIIGKHRDPGFTAQDNQTSYRAISQYNHFMLNGSLNMLPRIALDLAFFAPKRVKIFGADLYTSINYRNDYSIGGHESTSTVLRQHIAHDLITQYRLMQNLFLNGHFQADARLENVLNMGLENYLGIFQEFSTDC